YLDAELPGGCVVRSDDVVERLELGVHRQLAQLAQIVPARQLLQPEQPAPACAQRHGPLVAAAGHPVGRQDRSAREMPALVEVVVHERLKEQLVYPGGSPAREPPLAVAQRADSPGALHREGHGCGTGAPLAAAEQPIGRARERERRTDTPDEFLRARRREEDVVRSRLDGLCGEWRRGSNLRVVDSLPAPAYLAPRWDCGARAARRRGGMMSRRTRDRRGGGGLGGGGGVVLWGSGG